MHLGTLLVLFLVIQTCTGCGRKKRRRTYRPPVNRSPTIGCPKGGTFDAKYFKTYQTITYGSPRVSDDKGGYRVSRILGKSSGSNFYKGSNIVAYKVTDSGGLTDYCWFFISIKVITCNALGTPNHGRKRCDNSRNIYGTDCYFTCDAGFYLSGSKKSSCEKDGYYSHSTPSCRRVSCPSLSLPTNGLRFRCTNGKYYESFCSLECDVNRGYTPAYGSYTICKSDKTWSTTYFRCRDTEKPSFVNCPHATIKSYAQMVTWPALRVNDNSGHATMSLVLGQLPNTSFSVGEHVIRYDVVDRSGNRGYSCVFTVAVLKLFCQHPLMTFIGDFDLEFMNCDVNNTAFIEKSTCQTRCRSGTRVNGAQFVQCERSSNSSLVPTANWVPKYAENPYCPKRTCPSLHTPNNGAIVCDTFLSGTFCQIHCNDWFDIPEDSDGSDGYICGKTTKLWYPTDQIEDCTETYYGEYRLPGELYYFVGDCQDEETINKIKANFISALQASRTFSYLCADTVCNVDNVNITCGGEDEPDDERRHETVMLAEQTVDTSLIRDKRSIAGSGEPPWLGGNLKSTTGFGSDLTSTKPSEASGFGGNVISDTPYETPGFGTNLNSTTPSAVSGFGSKELSDTPETPGFGTNLKSTTPSEASGFGSNLTSETTDDNIKLSHEYNFNGTDVLSLYGSGSVEEASSGEKTLVIKDQRLVLSFNLTTQLNQINASKTEELLHTMIQETVIRLQESYDNFILYNYSVSNISVECQLGFVHGRIYRDRCVACSTGTFHNKSLDSCVRCPKNTYQHENGQTACLACPPQTGTLANGTKSMDGCIDVCKPHHYSPTGLVPCSVCPSGSYQPRYRSNVCLKCPSGTTTNTNSHKRTCTSYDVMVDGGTTLRLGSVISEWENKLTLALWLKLSTNDGSSPHVSMSLNHNRRGHQMTLNLSDVAKITMIDEELAVTMPLLKDKWFSFILVWRGYPRLLKLYQRANLLATSTDPTPLCYIPADTELNIEVGNQTVLYFRQLSITQDVKSSKEISALAQSCFTNTSRDVDLTSMDVSHPLNVHLVQPSTCYENDPCLSNPCNGHVCVSDNGRPRCLCHSGYTGIHCTQPPDFCKNHSCQNAATCVSSSTGFTCVCPPGVKGDMCETIIVNGNWSEWNSWSRCSKTCGGGIRSRQRTCDNPAPDSDGKPCPGSANHERRCNTQKCPECLASQLKAGHGISYHCNGARGVSLNCSISCAPGLMFSEAPTHYICYEEVWVPSDFTIGCTEPKLPEKAGFDYTFNYNVMPNRANLRDDTDIIIRTVSAASRQVKCSRLNKCESDVQVYVCRNSSFPSNGCKAGQTGWRVTIPFSSILNASLLLSIDNIEDLENLTDNVVNETVTLFNETQLELKSRLQELFSIRLVDGRIITPNQPIAETVIDCPNGAVSDGLFCVNCAPGSYQHEGTCIACDAGFYQNATGQTKCEACPGVHYTEFEGSTGLQLCITPPADMEMLITDPVNRSIWRVNMSSFHVQTLPLPARSLVSASTYNPMSRSIIYADRNTPAIHSSTRDMKSSRILVKLNWASAVVDMSLDVDSQLLFYTDKGNDHINVLSLNTRFMKTIVHKESCNPRSIVCDPTERVVYWTNWGKQQSIDRVNYDGSNRITVINTELQWPGDLTLDTRERQLYWTNTGLERIEVLDLKSNNRSTVILTTERYPSKLLLFMDYILYTELGVAETLVMRVNTDGSGNVWLDGLPKYKYISDINVYSVNYHKQGTSKCATTNGGCSHICFPTSGGRTCACNNTYQLQPDGISCSKKPWSWYWDLWMHTK